MANGQQAHIDMFKDNTNFTFKNIDISKEFGTSFFEGTDFVFHMAALADIVPSIENPLEYHSANVTGTVRVLKASIKYKIKKFVYTASSSCYGIPNKYPTSEDAKIKPIYPYAFTKYLGECYSLFMGTLYELPVVSLRLFNVYGPRARSNNTYGAVFKVFLKQKLENRPLTIVGDGAQTRDFTYVTDVVKAHLLAAKSNLKDEILNVGTGNPQSVNYLAKLIGGKTVSIPKRPGEPDSTHADVTKITKLLGWKPEVSFEEGVKNMVDNINYWKDTPLWTASTIKEATKTWFKYLGSSQKED